MQINKIEIENFCKSGLNIRKISNKTGIPYTKLYDFIKKNLIPHKGNFVDLTGKEFGRLRVLVKEGNSADRHIKWKCKCQCENEIVATSRDLQNGNTKSCGCLKSEKVSKRNKKNHGNKSDCWIGHGEIYGSFFNSIKRCAKDRGIGFQVSIEEVWRLFLKQNRRCALSNEKLSFQSSGRFRDGTASLDRIDSNGDYTIDNIQWIHKELNSMKMAMDEKKFLDWNRKIYEFRNFNR